MKRRYAKVGFWVAFVVCLAWWVVFEVWLPTRVEIAIREYFEEMEVEVEDLDLTWGSGSIVGIHLSGHVFEATSPEVFFSYSPVEWLLGDSNSIEVLRVSSMRLKPTEGDVDGEAFWKWLEKRRLDAELSALESLSVEGELYFAGVISTFDFRGRSPDFRGTARLPFTVEANAALPFFGLEVALPEKLSGTFDWDRTEDGDSAELKLTVNLSNRIRVGVSVSPGAEELSFLLGDEETPELWIQAVRPSGSTAFSGDWNATLVTADLISRWPLLALFNIESTAGGDFTWNPATNLLETGVAVVAEVSSFLFREAGIVKASATARLLLDENGTLVVRDVSTEVTDQLGERLEVQAGRPWRVGREKALFRVMVDNFRLGRFTTRLPAKVAFSGEADLEVDVRGALARFTQISLRRGGEDWAVLSGIAETSFGGDEEGTLVSFALECEPGPVLWGDLFPEGGFGEVFGKPGVRGRLKLAGGWKGGALEIASFEGSLATTMGERNLKARGLRPVRVFFREGEPSLVPAMEGDVDVFELSAVNLPLDGMLYWSEGRFQGDLYEGNGTAFFKGGQLGFRCGEVEVENGRILQGSKVLAENLNLRGSVMFVSEPKGGGELTLSNLHLLEEGTELASGDISLTLSRKEEGDVTLVTEVSSGGLEVDLTRLKHFGLPALPNIAEGHLRARNLKISFEKGFSVEMDASLSVKGTPANAGDERRALESGLRLTALNGDRGISTWMGLRLDGQPIPTTVEIDLVPENPVAKMSGENLDFADLVAFLQILSPEDANGNPLNPGEVLRGISKYWQINLGALSLPGGSVITKVAGEANASTPGYIDLSFFGELGGGTIASSGRLAWIKKGESPRIQNLRMAARDWNASLASVVREPLQNLAGRLSWDANGTFLPAMGFVGEANASVSGSSWTPLSDVNVTTRLETLSHGLARILGAEPVLSEEKFQVLRRLADLSGRLNLGEIRLRARVTPSGKVEVTELNFAVDDFLLRGVGEVLVDSSLKLSLRIGVKGAWAEALEAAGMLSEAKKDGDYRILKTDSLVVDGNWRKPDFLNLWRLLAEGLDLAPE